MPCQHSLNMADIPSAGREIVDNDGPAFFAMCCQCSGIIFLFGPVAFSCPCGHQMCPDCVVCSVEISSGGVAGEKCLVGGTEKL